MQNVQEFVGLVKQCCLQTKKQLFKQLKSLGFQKHVRSGRVFYFKPGLDTTSPMIVCHADTVVNGGNGKHNWGYDDTTATVTSIALDDRLGIACMMFLIDSDTDMATFAYLVCDDEEIGRSTAQEFDLDVEPNWLVELDRRGTDVVCYAYETPILCALLESAGFTIGSGTFSDISYLEHLEVIGFNVGIGYHREHSEHCHAKLTDTAIQLARLSDFAMRFSAIRLPHEPPRRYRTTGSKYYNDADCLRADDLWYDIDPFDIDEDDQYTRQKSKAITDLKYLGFDDEGNAAF